MENIHLAGISHKLQEFIIMYYYIIVVALNIKECFYFYVQLHLYLFSFHVLLRVLLFPRSPTSSSPIPIFSLNYPSNYWFQHRQPCFQLAKPNIFRERYCFVSSPAQAVNILGHCYITIKYCMFPPLAPISARLIVIGIAMVSIYTVSLRPPA